MEHAWKLTRGDGTHNGDRRSIEGYFDADNQWHRAERQIRCCGTWLDLDHFTNTCGTCWKDYNSAEQQLVPRSQWGEETGESVNDILSVDSASTDDLLDGE